MNQRLSRTAIRRDELVEGLNKGFEFTHVHLRQILVALAAVVALGLAWWGYVSWREGGQARASADLAEAQRIYAAPIVAPGAETDPAGAGELSFPSAEAHRDRAEQLFRALREKHGGAPANAAALYLARIAVEKGDRAEARRLWEEVVADDPSSMLGTLARLDLVRLARSEGKGEEALRELEEMLAAEDRRMPDDVVLYELAATLQALNRPAEARSRLQRIVDEFPRSAYRGAAQQELASLPPAEGAAGAAAR